MTRQEEKDLKEIAGRLPKATVQNPVYQVWGDPKRMYRSIVKGETSDVDVNHYRRLKRAYKKNGMAGVKHYLDQVHTQIKKQNAGLSNPPG